MIDREKCYSNLKRLVKIPGISGTEAEADVPAVIVEMLKGIPYFSSNPDNIRLVPLENDPLERSDVAAYLELHPESPETVILTGHYDVVDVEEYGHLKDIAFDIEAITEKITQIPVDEDTLKDAKSGEWIFGRGTADMKFGHALALELLRYYSDHPDTIKGNILYMAVCGEETNSEGMLRAVTFFNSFAEEKNIKYKALLLAECYMMEDQANNKDHYIHYGSPGKIMPMFFFAGESTHGGEPFLGIDPSLMSTEVYRRLELNTSFCQTLRGSTTPPPVCLKMQDLKTTYSASIPLYAAAYYTMITMTLDPEELTEKLKSIAYDSMKAAIDLVDEKAKEYESLTGEKTVKYDYTPCVMTYEELFCEAEKTYDGNLSQHLREYALDLQAEKTDVHDIAIILVKHIYELYKDKKPMIVLSYIPPYYPDTYLPKTDPGVAELMEACDKVIEYAREKYDEPLKMKDWYMGISDICYTGLNEGVNFDSLFKNLIGIDSVYPFPDEDLKKFRVPSIVLGGYGKDFHKHTERLHKHYNFDVLPDLYIQMINTLLR